MPTKIRSLSCLFLLLLGTTTAMIANAQEEGAPGPIPDALREDETSSPRRTLTRFLENTRLATEASRAAPISDEGFWALRRATAALDYSTTPHSGTWHVRIGRVLLLREILDRITLPPADEIPGDREVADGTITEWAILGTRLKIVRIESGPRGGEFLFSSDTVERLASHYRLVKHRPGKPGSLAGTYEIYLEQPDAGPTREWSIRNRLRGVDVSSPRSTFDGFLESINRAYRLIMDAEAAMLADPPTMTRAEAMEAEFEARNLLLRAVGTLDLSRVPEARRREVGLETVLRMKEIFDRMALPPLESIPNEDMVRAIRKGEARTIVRQGEPVRWKYPNTEFEIEERMEGDNTGSFYFSDETVTLVRDAYLSVRDLPYRPDELTTVSNEYLAPAKSEGFYEHYISTPGYLVPSASLMGSLVDRLPEWTHNVHGEQTLWQWIGLAVSILFIVSVGTMVFLFVLRLARRLDAPYGDWLRILAPLSVALLVIQVTHFVTEDINITGDVLGVLAVLDGLIILAMWAAVADWSCRAVAETVILSPKIPDEGINASLLRISARIVGFFIAIIIVVDGIRDLGVDPIPLVAGLGVGGLAVALAAQKTVANFIGSLILFANKPVRVGDFCAYGDGKIGTVEEINILSTRIRTLERSVVTIPNADFSEMELDNYTMRNERRLYTVLALRYETTPDQLRYVLAELRRLLLSHPMVNPNPARVRFVEYGAYSLDIEIFTYIKTHDHNTFLAIKEDILLRMADIVRAAGTGFAFPSQTTYLGRDGGLDDEQGRAAEERVQEWREKGDLPFPEFPESQQQDMAGALAYPPEGSAQMEPDEPDKPGVQKT